MTREALLEEIRNKDLDANAIIKLFDKTARYWINGDRKYSEDVELIIRLLDNADAYESILPGSRKILDGFARQSGLYPYAQDSETFHEALATEIHRVPNMEGFIFHKEQFSVFQKLLSGKNVVLSAPTSFGKTLLVDALIASKKPDNVIIIVPTIALLEERRRTLGQRFPQYKIITQRFQEIESKNNIILGTQERISERDDLPPPDLFVIDEFYKLDLTNSDSRAKTLNRVLATYIDSAAQIYLLGPSIETSPVDATERPDFEFIKTDYSPVTADIIYVEPAEPNPAKLFDLLAETLSGTASLVYCRSPKSARELSRALVKLGYQWKKELLTQISEWLRQNYHSNWYFADALERGIGMHHGRMPRSISHLMVKVFNDGIIEDLLCTSSLIEGVNTAAQNVIIYDKYISTKKLDRFTFDNIKGRAGRMFKHFVGKVFLFSPPPDPVYDALEIPLLQNKDKLPDEAIIHIDDNALSTRNKRRKDFLISNLDVPFEILKRYSHFGLQDIERLYIEVRELLQSGDRSLVWTGFAKYPTILKTMEQLWGRLEFEKHGVRSARQFALYATRLRSAQNIKEFLEQVANGDDVDDSIDLAFNFLKGAEYSFSEPFKLLEDIINSILEDERADYSKFVADLVSWNLPGNLKALEELGVPAPIIFKLKDIVDQYDVDHAMVQIRSFMKNRKHLSSVEIEVLKLTLADA